MSGRDSLWLAEFIQWISVLVVDIQAFSVVCTIELCMNTYLTSWWIFVLLNFIDLFCLESASIGGDRISFEAFSAINSLMTTFLQLLFLRLSKQLLYRRTSTHLSSGMNCE